MVKDSNRKPPCNWYIDAYELQNQIIKLLKKATQPSPRVVFYCENKDIYLSWSENPAHNRAVLGSNPRMSIIITAG